MARLVSFFVVFAIFLTFIVLNLENKCNVHLGFYVFNDVPIYITSFFSIFFGMIISIPLFSFLRRKKDNDIIKPSKKSKSSADSNDVIPGENGPYGIN